MAELHEGKEDLQRALQIWRTLLARSPESPKYLAQVSRLCVDLGQLREALEPARKLVRLRPSDLLARRRLVAALSGLNLPAEALPHLEWLRARAPNDAELHQELADAYQDLKRPQEALAHYGWLLARFPGNPEYRIGRASVLADLGREQEQLRELEQVVHRLPAPRAAAVHREMGELYYHEEEFSRAEQHLQAALRLTPPTAGPRLARADPGGRCRGPAPRAEELEQGARYADWLLDIQSARRTSEMITKQHDGAAAAWWRRQISLHAYVAETLVLVA